MNSNGQPIRNNFTTKININNNNIEGVKDIIIENKPISQTIVDFKIQDDDILSRLQINELQINTIQSNILNLQNENIKLKQIIYKLTNIIY